MKITHNHHYRIYGILLLVVSLAIISGCAEPDGSTGSSVGVNIGGISDSITCYVQDQISYADEPPGTTNSPYLYLGRAYGIESDILLRFLKPALPIEWEVDSAYIELSFQGHIGEDNFPIVRSSIVDYHWSESAPPSLAEIPAGYSVQTQYPPNDADSGMIKVEIPDSLISDWFSFNYSGIDTSWTDTTRADSGLSLHVINELVRMPTNLVRINSRSSLEDSASGNLRPRLYVYLTAADSMEGDSYNDTLTILANDDVFLPDYDTTETASNITFGSGAVFRSLIKFDFSQVYALQNSEDVAVNFASLSLKRDRTTPAYPFPETQAVYPMKITSDGWLENPKSAEFQIITLSSTGIDTSSEEVEIVITSLVSQWISDPDTNFGIALLSGAEALGIDRISYHGKNAGAGKRPELQIHVTRFPR